MPEKFQLINAVADDLDYDEIKSKIQKLYGDRADLFSFYESPAGELYLKLSSSESFRKPDEILLRLKDIVEKTKKGPVYTRDEAFFEAHNEKVRKQYMDEHDGRTPEEDGVIYIVLD